MFHFWIVCQKFIDGKSLIGKLGRDWKHSIAPVEYKESFRCIEVIRDIHKVSNLKTIRTIHVADREDAIYELYRVRLMVAKKFVDILSAGMWNFFIKFQNLDVVLKKRNSGQPTDSKNTSRPY